MEKLPQIIGPFLAIIAAPLVLWPSIILIVALVRQARGAAVLKPKYIGIFIAVQVVWIIVVYLFSNMLILRPLKLKF